MNASMKALMIEWLPTIGATPITHGGNSLEFSYANRAFSFRFDRAIILLELVHHHGTGGGILEVDMVLIGIWPCETIEDPQYDPAPLLDNILEKLQDIK